MRWWGKASSDANDMNYSDCSKQREAAKWQIRQLFIYKCHPLLIHKLYMCAVVGAQSHHVFLMHLECNYWVGIREHGRCSNLIPVPQAAHTTGYSSLSLSAPMCCNGIIHPSSAVTQATSGPPVSSSNNSGGLQCHKTLNLSLLLALYVPRELST